jgi:hypothetical protein
MSGLDGLAAVQSKIAAIQARVGMPVSSGTINQVEFNPTDMLSATDPAQSKSKSFASVLSDVTGSAATSTPDTRNAAYRTKFANDLLGKLGITATSENVKAIVAWAQAENTRAGHNPLATTRRHANTTNFNSVGVKNYSSYEDGLQATVDTLHNGHYADILNALRAGTSAMDVARAVAASPWGTGHGVERVLATTR